MKLQTKLSLALAPLIVLSLLTLGWIGYIKLRDTATERTLREMQTLLDQLGHNVQTTIAATQANLELFSRSDMLRRYVLTADETARYSLLQPTLLKQFASYQDAYPDYYEVRLLLPDGYEDTRSTHGVIPNVTEEEADTPWFRELREAPEDTVLNLLRNPDDQRMVLLAARKLRFRDPSLDPLLAQPVLRGYLVITMSLDFLVRQVESNRVGVNGSIFYTDDRGTVLFHPQRDRVGTTLAPELFAALRRAVANGEPLNAEVDGVKLLFQGRRLQQRLFLFAALPHQELLSASRELGRLVASITLLSIVITVSLLVLLLRYLVIRPVRELGRAALEIGQGNLLTPIETRTRDELGDLARAFREMAGNLARSDEQIRQLAFYDPLTGLPNRLLFKQHFDYAMARVRRDGRLVALLFLDIDNFKWVNDTLGHQVGDDFLKEMARRICRAVRQEDLIVRGGVAAETDDVIARLGGDEFLILLKALQDPRAAGTVAARILRHLGEPLLLADHEFHVTGSIGIAYYPLDGDTVDALIKNADVAMYEAKQSGKNNYRYYSDAMKATTLRRLDLEARLRHAVEHERLSLHYQPILNLKDGRVVGVETLLRWRDPEIGDIAPGEFIPLAEENGLILPITAWVLREACRQNRAWQQAGLTGLFVSVNVSGVDLKQANVHEVITAALRETGLEPEGLTVELTEAALMSARDRAAPILEDIKALGVRIVLDNFGSGYSSLDRLRRFPIDGLKIDRGFLANPPADGGDAAIGDAAIVATIVAIARNLELTVTAQGVETLAQREWLEGLGCDFAQGFWFSPAVSPETLPGLLPELAPNDAARSKPPQRDPA